MKLINEEQRTHYSTFPKVAIQLLKLALSSIKVCGMFKVKFFEITSFG